MAKLQTMSITKRTVDRLSVEDKDAVFGAGICPVSEYGYTPRVPRSSLFSAEGADGRSGRHLADTGS